MTAADRPGTTMGPDAVADSEDLFPTFSISSQVPLTFHFRKGDRSLDVPVAGTVRGFRITAPPSVHTIEVDIPRIDSLKQGMDLCERPEVTLGLPDENVRCIFKELGVRFERFLLFWKRIVYYVVLERILTETGDSETDNAQ